MSFNIGTELKSSQGLKSNAFRNERVFLIYSLVKFYNYVEALFCLTSCQFLSKTYGWKKGKNYILSQNKIP